MDQNPAAVILSYNHPVLTTRCLESVLKKFPPEHVFLVHNGSNPFDIESLYGKYPRIYHLILKENKGFAGGVNEGLKEGFKFHEAVFFFSNDTELIALPDWSELESCDFGSAVTYRRSTKVRHSVGAVDFRTGRLHHYDLKKHEFGNNSYVPGCAFFLKRRCWQAVGGFDDSLFAYWEDVDYSLRASRQGQSLKVLTNFEIRHGQTKTCGNDPFYSVYLFHKNRWIVTMRYASLWEKPSFCFHFFADMAKRSSKYIFRRDFRRFHLLSQGVFHGLKATINKAR